MKIALYIDDGREQIVLTPETDFEKAILGKLREAANNPGESGRDLLIETGGFYSCAGGWTRHDEAQESLFIVLDQRESSPSEAEND